VWEERQGKKEKDGEGALRKPSITFWGFKFIWLHLLVEKYIKARRRRGGGGEERRGGERNEGKEVENNIQKGGGGGEEGGRVRKQEKRRNSAKHVSK